MADISTITASNGTTYNIKDSTARNILIPKDTNGNTSNLRRPLQLKGAIDDITLDGKIDEIRANRLAFLPADQIIVEETTDGGTTWTDAGFSNNGKLGIFSQTNTQYAINIPLKNGVRSIDCGVRITFTAMKYDVPSSTTETNKYNYWNSSYVLSVERYNRLKELYFFVSAVNDGIGITVQRAKGNDSNNWSTIYSNSSYAMTGWSGPDYVRFSQDTFGGSTTQVGNFWNYRLILMTRDKNGGTDLSTSSTTTKQSIIRIKGYGDAAWTYKNNLMFNDHLYNWDINKNVTFPAKVTVSSAPTANMDVATKKYVDDSISSVPDDKIVFVDQTSTFSAIYNAKQNGYIPVYKDSDGFAFPEQVEDSSPNEFIFTKTTDTGTIVWYKVDSVGTWTSGTTSGGGGGSNLFIANYNTTTYSAISTAKAANKVIICKPVNINEGYALLADFEAPSGGGHGISIYDSGFWWLVLQATTVPTTDISVVLHYGSGDETVTVPANEWGNDGTPNQWSCYNLPKDPYEEGLSSVTEVGASPASGSATFSSTKGNKIYTYTVDLNDNWSWSSVTVPSASVNTTITLSSSGWSETSAGSGIYYQGVTPSSGGSSIDPLEYSTITVSPQGNPSAYANAGIWCDTASYYLLPFYCTSVPTTNIVVNVVLT